MPTWQNFVVRPNYDAFWKTGRTSRMMPTKVRTPKLIVAGWWDQEDFYGSMKIYAERVLERRVASAAIFVDR